MDSRLACAFLLCVLVLTGCEMTAVQHVAAPDPGTAITKPDHCRIYLYRDNPGAVRDTLHVWDLEKAIGEIGRGDYLLWERPAGITSIRMKYVKAGKPDVGGRHAVELEAGKTYYWNVEWTEISRRPKIKSMTKEAALKDLATRKLAGR